MPPPASRFGPSALSVLLGAALATGCTPAFERLARKHSPRGSLGEEVYKLVCRRVAGTELPQDLEGGESAVLCLGDAASVAAELDARGPSVPAPLAELAARRSQLVEAVDALAPPPLAHEASSVFELLVPFYGEPDPRVPVATRAMARWLAQLAQDAPALRALTRTYRDGMVPPREADGLLRALSAAPDLSTRLSQLLPALLDGTLRADLRALLVALALGLTSASATDHSADLARIMALADPEGELGDGPPLDTARRDARGLPMPLGPGVPFPFVDGDADGLADTLDDRLAVDPRFGASAPEPYAVLNEPNTARDAGGRACALGPDGSADCARTLYEHTPDRAGTLLAALVPELKRAADGPLLTSALKALPALLGAPVPRSARFGAYEHAYQSGADDEPLVALLAALSGPEASDRYDASLRVLTQLLGPQRKELAAALAPWLSLLARTGPGSDAYPEAALSQPNTFWDELLWEAELLSRRRTSAGGESALGALMRGALGYKSASGDTRFVEPARLAHVGSVLSFAMRFKDEWRPSPHTDDRRPAGEPAVVGGFSVPVDRAAPDVPLECGRDGCGGPIAGTPYAAIALPGQRCLVEHDSQRGQGDDCGSPGNQSILQRALGLISEGSGRSQCNRALTVADLVNEALGDPCTSLEPVRSCTRDADCAGLSPPSADYACDPLAAKCVARPGSPLCAQLTQKAREDRAALVFVAEQVIALDYVCPADDPSAPCHGFEAAYPAAFSDRDGDGPLPPTMERCHLIDMPDVGRVFGTALGGSYRLDIPNPWVYRLLEDIARAGPVSASDGQNRFPDCDLAFRIVDPRVTPSCIPGAARATRALYDDIPAEVDQLGELIEFLVGDDTLFSSDTDAATLRPDARVLTRVLFSAAPAEGVQLFDPLLLRGAPPACSAALGLPACALSGPAEPAGTCCLADPVRPPLQYRLDTYFGGTSFALEHAVRFDDGSTLSLFDAMEPVAAAIVRVDVAPHGPAPLPDVEYTDYPLFRVGKLLAEHYDSSVNDAAQRSDPTGRWYRRGTGLVRYERMLAELLDQQGARPGQLGPAQTPLFSAAPTAGGEAYARAIALLAALDASPGALDALVRGSELLLNPHAFCAGDGGDDRVLSGRGACDAAIPARAPLADLRDQDTPCWNDGRCFDGAGAPRRFVSALGLTRSAASALLGRARERPGGEAALHQLLVDASAFFFASDAQGFAAPRAVAMLRALGNDARAQWAARRARGELEGAAAQSLADVRDALHGPEGAALLALAARLGADAPLVAALSSLLSSATAAPQARALVASISDLLERAHAAPVLSAAEPAFAALLVPNVAALLAGTGRVPELDDGTLFSELRVLETLTANDPDDVLAQLGANATGAARADAARSPVALLADLTLAVHRREPRARTVVSADDVGRVVGHLAELLVDERRGVERLIAIVRCATAEEPKPTECRRAD